MIRKQRREMGEEAWAVYQKGRKYKKSWKYKQTDKGKLNSFMVAECRRNNKLKLIEYKGGHCQKCGYNKPIPGAYDFHHLNPNEKDFSISREGDTKSLERLKIEVDKCILVCRNCHAEIHHEIEQIKIELKRKELLLD
jgi:hypothetical protein